MAAPTRFPTGLTQAATWQPLGQIGVPDPFFYNVLADDFLPFTPAEYTITTNNGGTVVGTPGSGGQILFTTGSIPGNYASIQSTAAGFQYVKGKKLAYAASFQLQFGSSRVGILGLIQTTTTPNTVTDGFYFSNVSGNPVITFNIASGGTIIGSTTYLLPNVPNGTFVDVAFAVDPDGNTDVYFGVSALSKIDQNVAYLGPIARVPFTSLTAPLTSALLNPTISVTNIGGGITGVADFIFAAQER